MRTLLDVGDVCVLAVLGVELGDLVGEVGVHFFLEVEVLLEVGADVDEVQQPARDGLVDEAHFLVLFGVVVQFLGPAQDELQPWLRHP